MSDGATLVREDGVAWLRIDRPRRLNALDRPTYATLRHAVETVGEDPDCRVIVLTGVGRAFCVGADLKARSEDPEAADVGVTLRDWAAPLLRSLRTVPQPVVAAINGPAVGIGCSLALACDILVAASSAYLSLPFARVGLGPDGAAVLRVAARAGAGRAARMALLGDRVDAATALEWGLVDRVVGDADLETTAAETAATIALGAPLALAATKHSLELTSGPLLEQTLAREATVQGRLSQTIDHREALAAFAEKRPPRFLGR